MIRIGVGKVYGMNDVTSFTEEDFKNATELKRELDKNRSECNKKMMDELTKQFSQTEVKKPEPEKNPFYSYNVFFRSEEAPGVYKLSGDLSSFNEQDLEFNNILPQRVSDYLSDYLESQKKKCIDELSNKDLLKRPFIEPKEETRSKDELAGRLDEEFTEVPKPPLKWKKFTDKDGDVYYYNLVTKTSQWNRPDEFEDPA